MDESTECRIAVTQRYDDLRVAACDNPKKFFDAMEHDMFCNLGKQLLQRLKHNLGMPVIIYLEREERPLPPVNQVEVTYIVKMEAVRHMAAPKYDKALMAAIIDPDTPITAGNTEQRIANLNPVAFEIIKPKKKPKKGKIIGDKKPMPPGVNTGTFSWGEFSRKYKVIAERYEVTNNGKCLIHNIVYMGACCPLCVDAALIGMKKWTNFVCPHGMLLSKHECELCAVDWLANVRNLHEGEMPDIKCVHGHKYVAHAVCIECEKIAKYADDAADAARRLPTTKYCGHHKQHYLLACPDCNIEQTMTQMLVSGTRPCKACGEQFTPPDVCPKCLPAVVKAQRDCKQAICTHGRIWEYENGCIECAREKLRGKNVYCKHGQEINSGMTMCRACESEVHIRLKRINGQNQAIQTPLT